MGVLWDMFREMDIKPSRKQSLRQIFLELTKQCNMNCKHCGSNCSSANNSSELSTRQWKQFVSYIASHFDNRQIMFCITGGEPLIRNDFFEIVSHIKDCGFKWGLTTNGLLINKDIAKRLYECGMASVSVSLDGMKANHDKFRNSEGSFEKVVAGIRELIRCRHYESVQVTTVVNKENINDLPELYELIKQIGAHDWRIASIDPIGRANENADLLLDDEDFVTLFEFITKLKRHNVINVQYGCAHYVPKSFDYDLREMPYRCGAGEFVASVLHNGDIFSCIDIERRPELIQGNILKDDFLKVWINGFDEFKAEVRVSKSNKCKNCSKLKYCKGDSAHTWDYSKNEPMVCLHERLKKNVYTAQSLCGMCGKRLREEAEFCERCGTKRGEGAFNFYAFEEKHFQTLYGPPPMEYRFTCKKCSSQWNRVMMDASGIRYCPKCGAKAIQVQQGEWSF